MLPKMFSSSESSKIDCLKRKLFASATDDVVDESLLDVVPKSDEVCLSVGLVSAASLQYVAVTLERNSRRWVVGRSSRFCPKRLLTPKCFCPGLAGKAATVFLLVDEKRKWRRWVKLFFTDSVLSTSCLGDGEIKKFFIQHAVRKFALSLHEFLVNKGTIILNIIILLYFL